MTDNTETKKNENELAGVDIRKIENGTILVALANHSQIPLQGLALDTPARDILGHLQKVSENKALKNAVVDQDETDPEKNIRVITLKTNVAAKG